MFFILEVSRPDTINTMDSFRLRYLVVAVISAAILAEGAIPDARNSEGNN